MTHGIALGAMSLRSERLALPFACGLVAWGLPIVLIAPLPYPAAVIALLAVIGAANSVVSGSLTIGQGCWSVDAGRGGFFGEIALLHDAPRMATVRAITGSRLYALERDDFLDVVTGNPLAHTEAHALATARLDEVDTSKAWLAPATTHRGSGGLDRRHRCPRHVLRDSARQEWCQPHGR